MKHTMVFNLPEDREDLELHLTAPSLNGTLYDLDSWLRNQTKHAEHSPRVEVLQEVRDKLYEFLNDNGAKIV